MKDKIKRYRLYSKQGLTLVEVVVSVALLAILSLMLVSAMVTSLSAVSATRKRTSTAMTAAGNIEAQRAAGTTTNGVSSSLAITFNGTTYTVNGTYVPSGTGVNGNVTYKEFVPN